MLVIRKLRLATTIHPQIWFGRGMKDVCSFCGLGNDILPVQILNHDSGYFYCLTDLDGELVLTCSECAEMLPDLLKEMGVDKMIYGCEQ